MLGDLCIHLGKRLGRVHSDEAADSLAQLQEALTPSFELFDRRLALACKQQGAGRIEKNDKIRLRIQLVQAPSVDSPVERLGPAGDFRREVEDEVPVVQNCEAAYLIGPGHDLPEPLIASRNPSLATLRTPARPRGLRVRTSRALPAPGPPEVTESRRRDFSRSTQRAVGSATLLAGMSMPM